ncbi:hypothetical protein L6452_03279 [Arctium lappa]|uniref:Uncharacterized protein n=1 Tax=Arctium lappa TaxID=4217 RepID=A0ACB9FL84_ARCLA|nr:hypothetical protein L6452_03279 [Arctium lappa]
MESSYSVNEVYVSDIVESGDGFADVGFRVSYSSEKDVPVVEDFNDQISLDDGKELVEHDDRNGFLDLDVNDKNIDEDDMDSADAPG